MVVTQSSADFSLASNTVQNITMTPISPAGDYQGAYLVSQPIQPDFFTNGTGVFSNMVSGYAYKVNFQTRYASTFRTNFFPTSLSNSVNGHQYVGWIIGFGRDGSVLQFAYFYITNSISPHVVTNGQPAVSLPNNTGASGQSVTLAGGSQTGGQPAGGATIAGGTGSSGSRGGDVVLNGGNGVATGKIIFTSGLNTNAVLDWGAQLATFNIPLLAPSFVGNSIAGGNGTIYLDIFDGGLHSTVISNSIGSSIMLQGGGGDINLNSVYDININAVHEADLNGYHVGLNASGEGDGNIEINADGDAGIIQISPGVTGYAFVSGNFSVSGNLTNTAGKFIGNGSGLGNVTATNVVSGIRITNGVMVGSLVTVTNATGNTASIAIGGGQAGGIGRLISSTPSGMVIESVQFAGGVVSGSGAGLTSLPGAQVTGTLPNASLPPNTVTNSQLVAGTNAALVGATNTALGALASRTAQMLNTNGDAGSLTNLQASQIKGQTGSNNWTTLNAAQPGSFAMYSSTTATSVWSQSLIYSNHSLSVLSNGNATVTISTNGSVSALQLIGSGIGITNLSNTNMYFAEVSATNWPASAQSSAITATTNVTSFGSTNLQAVAWQNGWYTAKVSFSVSCVGAASVAIITNYFQLRLSNSVPTFIDQLVPYIRIGLAANTTATLIRLDWETDPFQASFNDAVQLMNWQTNGTTAGIITVTEPKLKLSWHGQVR